MEKKISYLNRNFSDYRNALIDFTKEYYPTLADKFNDASIGSWLIDIVAGVSDNLSYLTDRVYQEVSVNNAQQMMSLMNLARSKGLKVPGPKSSVAEVEITCVLPVNTKQSNSTSTLRSPSWEYAPLLRKGMQFSAGSQIFELDDDVDFNNQFNKHGFQDRTINVNRNSNGAIVSYTIGKKGFVVSGESKIYRRVIRESDIIPFMEFVIPDSGVMNVESIIFKDGTDYLSDPDASEFEFLEEFTSAENNKMGGRDVYRFFEVDSLAEQSRWGEVTQSDGNPEVYQYAYPTNNGNIPVYSVTKGEWKPLKQKFITEFTDKGYLKIIFGAGTAEGQNVDFSNASSFGKYQISRMINNESLGVLPKAGMTMFVKYRVGGGSESNVAEGAINTITSYDIACNSADNDPTISDAVRRSLTVRNTTPSLSGKDMPTEDEIRNLIKYSNGAQNRCVTVKDYYERILKIPPKYGCPFRVGVQEENNKIRINVLGIDAEKHLSGMLPDFLVKNILNYLSEYKMVNDYVEVMPGRIINISVEGDIFIGKDYNTTNVVKNVISTIQDYLDVENHQMGEDIYTGDIIKEIMKIDGVLNVKELRIYNEIGPEYSSTQTTLPEYTVKSCDSANEDVSDDSITTTRKRIDIDSTEGILFADTDCMFEIKYPERDIRIRPKER